MIQNPANVSRTLSTEKRSLVRVIAAHDRRITDADVNLIQSLQDEKRRAVLNNQVCSGVLTYKPFTYTSNQANTFLIPTFDVLMQGEVVTIGGHLSRDLAQNAVVLPPPTFWTSGLSTSDATLYIVYLELWIARLSPGPVGTGDGSPITGYYQDPTSGLLSYYPYGCVNADVSNLIPNDTVDLFQGIKTTERAQLQWAIRAQAVDPSYDFTQFQFGLDAGPTASTTVYAQGGSGAPTALSFANMGTVNGDTGLWRSGDENTANVLGTMDGCSYAMPLAVVFQRNTGPFSVETNPFGCADPQSATASGLLLTSSSGRYDSKYADLIYPQDVVDTRSTISLDGWDHELLLKRGFVDVVTGNGRQRISRGETPGNKATALGSLLSYTISVGSTTFPHADNVGQFDGFMNGFGASQRTFYVNRAFSTAYKSVGLPGKRWVRGDAFVVSLPQSSLAVITSIQVHVLVDNTVNSTKSPAPLLQGQITTTGLGTHNVTITFATNLQGTSFDPSNNSVYVLFGVQYPAGIGMDLRRVPENVHGGLLQDGSSGKTLPVFGVSEYEVQAAQVATSAQALWAVNSEYSNLIFGTRVWLAVPAYQAMANTTTTSVSIPRTALNGKLTGMYVTRAWDQDTGSYYTIAGRSISGPNFILTVQGIVADNSTMIVSFLCTDTAQLVYNAPTKSVTAIEETILAGNATDPSFLMDSRVAVVSVLHTVTSNTVVLAANGAVLRAISGDDVNKLIWVQNTGTQTWDAVQIGSATFQNGLVTLVVPPTVNLQVQPFFVVAAIYPSLTPNSKLTLVQDYVPYQGEGTSSTTYEILTTEDVAMVTTNGTGAAPVPGLADVYPYDRELPIATTLPALGSWPDATLANTAVASFFDSNYEAMRQKNVEHTFDVPIHANDFIESMNSNKRKTIQLQQSSGERGFAKATPHVGFAIRPLTNRSLLGANLQATTSPITLFVNNIAGSDTNDGLTTHTPLLSVQAALAVLPPVLRHPCSVQLMYTGTNISMSALSSSLLAVPLGDGDVRALNLYVLGNLAFTTQGAGRLVLTTQPGATLPVTIDASGFAGFGDGPTSAFLVDNSRVIFNRIGFMGFRDAAVKGLDADVTFVDCTFTNNLTSGSFEQGSTIVLDGGTVQLTDGGTGFILSGSSLDVANTELVVAPSAAAGAFFVAERGSSLTLDQHSLADETNVTANTLVAVAELNSSIVCTTSFQSNGNANLTTNSVLQRTVAISPLLGGVTYDSSSSVTTSL